MAIKNGLLKVLVEEGLLTQEQAEAVVVEASQKGLSEERVVEEKGWVEKKELTRARAKVLGFPFVSLAETPISPEAVALVSEAVARTYRLIPLRFDRRKNELAVAMANPLDLEAIEFLEKKTGSKGLGIFALVFA